MKDPTSRRRTLRIVGAVAILLILVVVGVAARTIKRTNQSIQSEVRRDALVEQVEKSVDIPPAIQQDDDSPVRILEAKVKEISPSDYQRLTSEKSDFASVVSAPQIKVMNVSDKTVSKIMLIVNDVSAQRSTGIVMRNLSIAPGATFSIAPSNFVKQENVTSVDESGTVSSAPKGPMKSKKYWLPFGDKTQLRVRVGVEFQDRTTWFNRDQRRGN